MAALDRYLESVPRLDLGSITTELERDPTSNTAWLQFGGGVSKQVWSALPPEFRSIAMAAIDAALSAVRDSADLAVSVALETLGGIGGALEGGGMIVDLVAAGIKLVQDLTDAILQVRALDSAVSGQYKNIAQRDTLLAVGGATRWAVGLYEIENYPFYESDPGDRVDGVRWRRRPCIYPSARDAAVWGLGWAPIQTGSCYPGRELERKGAGYKFEAQGGSNCKGYAAISSLFWPFWSPNHEPMPIVVVGPDAFPKDAAFRPPGVDPNVIMIARQQALLADPWTNFRVRGAALEGCLHTFRQYFRDKVSGFGGMMPISDFRTGAGMYPTEKTIERWPIAPRFNPTEQYDRSGPRFYFDQNGMVRPYESFGTPDLADVGVPSFAPPLFALNLGYSAAQYNSVVGGVAGFFTARSAMLTNRYLQRELLKRPRWQWDPDALEAMIEAAR